MAEIRITLRENSEQEQEQVQVEFIEITSWPAIFALLRRGCALIGQQSLRAQAEVPGLRIEPCGPVGLGAALLAGRQALPEIGRQVVDRLVRHGGQS